MLSVKNIEKLEKYGIDYVIGARIGNTNLNEAQIIAGELNQIDKKLFDGKYSL